MRPNMNCSSSIVSIVVVLIVLCQHRSTTNTTTTSDSTVETIGIKDTLCYNITNNYDLEMRAVLLVPGKLYIITEQWMIYDIPVDSADDIKQLAKKLKSVKAESLVDIWTGCNVSLFTSNKDKIITMYSTNEDNQTIVYMNIPNQRGLQYNIKTNNLTHGVFYNTSNSIHQKMVAPITGTRFYTIEYDKPDGDLYFIKWIYEKDPISNGFNQIPTEPLPIYYSPANKIIRLYNQNDTDVVPDFERVRGEGDWQIINGITFKERFLLFTPRLLYNFSESVTTPGYEVHVDTINLKELFECDVIETITVKPLNISGIGFGTTDVQSQSIRITMMFVAAVAILIIILFAIYYIKKYMTDDPQSVNHSNSKYRRGSTSRSRRQMRDSLSRSRQIMAGSESKNLMGTKYSYSKNDVYGGSSSHMA